MGRKRGGERYLGPYAISPGRWRVIYVAAGAERKDWVSHHFSTEAEAKAFAAGGRKELHDEGRTVGAMIEGYLKAVRSRSRKPVDTARCAGNRLRYVLTDETRPVASLTPMIARELYRKATERTVQRKRRGPDGWVLTDQKGAPLWETIPTSPTTHNQCLRECRAAFTWAVEAGWINASPFAAPHVKFTGKVRTRRRQHHRDEAATFVNTALEMGAAGDAGAVAVAVQLLLGCRPSEVLLRRIRDLDDAGYTLVIEDAKTPSGWRRVHIPEVVRPLLAHLADGKRPLDFIFPRSGKSVMIRATERVCAAAGLSRVVAYSLRGCHASLSVEEGATSEIVARALGHANKAITEKHYIEAASLSAARARKAVARLTGETLAAVPFFSEVKQVK